MRKIGKLVIGLLALSTVSGASFAANLVQVFQQALVNDPTFMKAQADWLTAREGLPLAMTGTGAAGTGLFPNITASGLYNDNYSQINNHFGTNSGNFISKSYLISVTQPIFNLSTWMSISSARYSVRAATATYLAAAQDLMSRTANAYYEVLRANAKLTLTLAQKKQFLHQLVTAEQKFRVGLIAITGVYDAQSSYDRSIADEIKDRNDLQDRLEDLRAITGKKYTALLDLKANIPLLVPHPDNIVSWVKISLKQNYNIQRDLNNMYAAQQNIKAAGFAKFPTLNFTGSWQDGRTGGVNQPPSLPRLRNTPTTTTESGAVGLSLNFPILRGGFDIVNTQQKRYQYLSASDQLAIDHRTVENDTRQAFLGIDSGISQIKADEQAIISARNQLEATKAGYIVGTRTMVDVLDSVTTLTQSQLAYADDRYNYVEGIVNLKEQAGVLSPGDIKRLNRWLGPNIKFSLKQPAIKIRPSPKGMPQVKANLLEINTPEATSPKLDSNAEPKIPSSISVPDGTDGGKPGGPTATPPSSTKKAPDSGDATPEPSSVTKTAPTEAELPAPSTTKSSPSTVTPSTKAPASTKAKSPYGVSKESTTTLPSLPYTPPSTVAPTTKGTPSSTVTPAPSYQAPSKITPSSTVTPTPSKITPPSSTTTGGGSPYGKAKAPTTKPSYQYDAPSKITPPSTLPSSHNTKHKLHGHHKHHAQNKVTKKGYSIELFASHSKSYAQKFYKQNKKYSSLFLVKAQGHHKGWYRVVKGHYKTQHEAIQALHKLPKALTALHPWVVYLHKYNIIK